MGGNMGKRKAKGWGKGLNRAVHRIRSWIRKILVNKQYRDIRLRRRHWNQTVVVTQVWIVNLIIDIRKWSIDIELVPV